MNRKILVTYKSVTGFTAQYAQWIAQALGCEAVELKRASAKMMQNYDVVIYGSRGHAGVLSGLKKARKRFARSGAGRLMLFATGATSASEAAMIEAFWKNNLTPQEAQSVPHFYMPGGLRYENMPWIDRLMMKVFCSMLQKKQDKTPQEEAMAKAVQTSFDISSKDYIAPLVQAVQSTDKEK